MRHNPNWGIGYPVEVAKTVKTVKTVKTKVSTEITRRLLATPNQALFISVNA